MKKKDFQRLIHMRMEETVKNSQYIIRRKEKGKGDIKKKKTKGKREKEKEKT